MEASRTGLYMLEEKNLSICVGLMSVVFKAISHYFPILQNTGSSAIAALL